jgi:hypothetical protein
LAYRQDASEGISGGNDDQVRWVRRSEEVTGGCYGGFVFIA